MGVRLSEEEAWAMIESSHTGIWTTLTRDGWPVSLPIWFTVVERSIYVRTPVGAKKTARVRHDDRGCFLVERGMMWSELAAVEVPVHASVVTDPAIEAEVVSRLASKYKGFRTESPRMPSATKKHYASATLIRLEPSGKMLSWDNARIRLLA